MIIGLWNGTGPTRSAAWYSATGRDWKLATTSLAGFDARGIAAVGGRIVVVGDDLSDAAPGLAASWSSVDGNTWTESTAPTDQPTVGLDGVAAVDGALLAFGAPPPSTTGRRVGRTDSARQHSGARRRRAVLGLRERRRLAADHQHGGAARATLVSLPSAAWWS